MALYQVSSGDRILAADINQFYSILKGVAASGEAVTLIYNAAGSVIIQPSSDPAAGTEAIQIKNNAGTVQSAFSFDGRLYPADGLVGTPGIAFEQDKDTGIYRIGANSLGMVAGGVEKWAADANTLLARTLPAEVLAADRWEWYWVPVMTTETTFTGTGSYTANTINDSAALATGATSGSTAGLRKLLSTNINAGPGVGGLRRWSFTAGFVDIDANTTAYILMTNESATGAPSLTARHVGIKNVAGAVSFTTGDNTTEQATVITTFVTAAQDNRFTVTFDGTTVRLYIDGTLRATHATNVPGAASINPVFRLYITNSTASTKQVIVGRQGVSLAVA